MTKLRCIIVDDEPAAIRLLEKFISKVSFLELNASFTKPLEALAYLESNALDLIFLDVQMPQLTGIQLSKIINPQTQIIFTTAYSEFALESYDVNALDYLLKPIAFERFYKAVNKLQTDTDASLEEAIVADNYLFVKTDAKHSFKKVFLKDLKFIEGLKNYVSLQINAEQIITQSTMKHLIERLPSSDFQQIHKSFIVALSHIERIENDAVWIQGRQLPIGNTFRKGFFEAVNSKKL